jgi:hypothetical protein
MAKIKNVYYVFNIRNTDFVRDVEPAFLGTSWRIGSALTVKCLARCETPEEVIKERNRLGGVIFVGIE